MSAEQYRRTMNTLDREIANLEKKRADADKKAADEHRKAANILISKTASESMIRSKQRQKESHIKVAMKAQQESAFIAAKIASKKEKRNNAALRLQKEEDNQRKKQENTVKHMKQSYEQKIRELQEKINTEVENSIEIDNDSTEYDVFVSHAWEDKKDFVDELVNALRALNIRVWYDTSEMKWGDSLRKRIDEGLRKSRFGIAVLSPSYIAEGKYWTKTELDGLFQLESINGKTILPIWHKLTKKEVMDYSPILASKMGLSTAMMTAEEIALKLKDLLPEEDTESANQKEI